MNKTVAENSRKRPNILIFMTDQQRASTIYGDGKAITPNLDKFRKQGVTFSNAFCPSPHCCPSRATFMSGLYPSQHGVWHNVNVTNAISRGLSDGVRLWSEDFAEAGYKMYYTGKWHVSAVEEPGDRGWLAVPERNGDCFIKTPEEAWEDYRRGYDAESVTVDRVPTEIQRPGWKKYFHYGISDNPFDDNDVTSVGVEVLKRHCQEESPWCQFVGTLGPHDPYCVPQKFLDMYDINEIELPDNFNDTLSDRPGLYRRTRDVFAQLSTEEHRQAILHYKAFCSYEDYLFGELLTALEQSGQAENTMVVYLSDHGDYMGEHSLWCKGLPCFRGAYEIPCVIRWPQGIENPGRVVDEFVSLADFAPTFLEVAEIKTKQKFFGSSLLPFLNDTTLENWRDTVYTQSNGNEQYGIQRSVMNRKWKYVYNGFDYDELYDLENDPGESVNLINRPEHADIVKAMCKKMWQLGYEANDNCINPYIMIGFAPYGPGIAFEEPSITKGNKNDRK